MCPMLFELQQDRPCRSVYDTKLANLFPCRVHQLCVKSSTCFAKIGDPLDDNEIVFSVQYRNGAADMTHSTLTCGHRRHAFTSQTSLPQYSTCVRQEVEHITCNCNTHHNRKRIIASHSSLTPPRWSSRANATNNRRTSLCQGNIMSTITWEGKRDRGHRARVAGARKIFVSLQRDSWCTHVAPLGF